MSKWFPYPEIQPDPKARVLLVYIDQTASNTPDTVTTKFWDGKAWDEVGREQKVTYWRIRPKPPKDTWMRKQGIR